LLLRAVDLGVGGVEIDRGPLAGQRRAGRDREQFGDALTQGGHPALEASEVHVFEPASQRDRGWRRRRLGNRAHLRAGGVAAHRVEVAEEVAAGEHHLGQRDHDPARAVTLTSGLDRIDRRVESGHQAHNPIELGDQHQPSGPGQLRVGLSQSHPTAPRTT